MNASVEMMEEELDQEAVRRLFDYDQESGALVWREREVSASHDAMFNSRWAGQEAGYVSNGHILVNVNYKMRRASRLIWLWMTGAYPDGQIDHIDHDPLNNSWANLRVVTDADNKKNLSMRSDNTSGVTGVAWYKPRSKWRVQIQIDGTNRHVCYSDNLLDAVAARKSAEQVNGFHPNHGKSL